MHDEGRSDRVDATRADGDARAAMGRETSTRASRVASRSDANGRSRVGGVCVCV